MDQPSDIEEDLWWAVEPVDKISDVLKDLSLSDILEHCNMTEEEALDILIGSGLLDLPPFLEHLYNQEEDNDNEQW